MSTRVRWWFLFIAALGLSSCRKPVTAEFDRPFDLRVGQAARFPKDGLELLFRRVSADSRCPRNAQCIWAGEARVVLEGPIAKGSPEPFEVRLAGGGTSADSSSWKAYHVQVLALEPYPVAGTKPDSTAYIATLKVERR